MQFVQFFGRSVNARAVALDRLDQNHRGLDLGIHRRTGGFMSFIQKNCWIVRYKALTVYPNYIQIGFKVGDTYFSRLAGIASQAYIPVKKGN